MLNNLIFSFNLVGNVWYKNFVFGYILNVLLLRSFTWFKIKSLLFHHIFKANDVIIWLRNIFFVFLNDCLIIKYFYHFTEIISMLKLLVVDRSPSIFLSLKNPYYWIFNIFIFFNILDLLYILTFDSFPWNDSHFLIIRYIYVNILILILILSIQLDNFVSFLKIHDIIYILFNV